VFTAANPTHAADTSSARDRGFTLVEILIAIVLVGILSAVVVVGVSNLTEKGSSSACSASLDAAKTGSVVYFTSNMGYPTTLAQMTSANPPMLTLPQGVTLNASVVGGNAAGTMASGQGWTLTMTPGATGVAPTFSCSTGNAASSAPAGTTACPGTYNGWVGEYYSGLALGGTATCRDDATLNFNWANGAPIAGVPADNFSVRWTRSVTFTAGSHNFTVGSDDGTRVYVDGTILIDYWNDRSYATQSAARTLTAGTHVVVMEFYERGGQAQATLSWT